MGKFQKTSRHENRTVANDSRVKDFARYIVLRSQNSGVKLSKLSCFKVHDEAKVWEGNQSQCVNSLMAPSASKLILSVTLQNC